MWYLSTIHLTLLHIIGTILLLLDYMKINFVAKFIGMYVWALFTMKERSFDMHV